MITNETSKLAAKTENTKTTENGTTVTKVKFNDAIPQIVASCGIYLTVLQAGFNLSFSSILLPQLSLPDSGIQIDLNSSSTVASIVTILTAAGALACGPLMDNYGRM
jgi:hypothetical protein